MVVWEDGAMKKADYRKFQVKTVTGVDDFASMREIIHRRYKRLQEDRKPFPSLILIDGGLGQLHAAAEALREIGIEAGNSLQPLASIAKREEIIYVHGQEDEPVVLDRRSPVLHLIQKIRDESHRFAVTYHRKRREIRDRDSELDATSPASAPAPASASSSTSAPSAASSRPHPTPSLPSSAPLRRPESVSISESRSPIRARPPCPSCNRPYRNIRSS